MAEECARKTGEDKDRTKNTKSRIEVGIELGEVRGGGGRLCRSRGGG